jgi:glycosyltransferase involved in cell wall biosynthesis
MYKNNSNIKLSIAIPTYNGAKYIRKVLDSIVCQLDDVDEEIEIVISDNASTDETPQIIKAYQKKYPFIEYFRNDKNLGVDRNFDLAIQSASGEYVWFFGDDDIMMPGAIKRVVTVITNHYDVDYFFANCSIWNEDFTECRSTRFISIENDMICETADKFFSLIGVNAALTPSTIIRKDLWIGTPDTSYTGTNWGVLAKLFYMLPSRVSFIIAEPLVKFNSSSTRCHKDGKFYEMVLILYGLIDQLPSLGYTQDTYSEVKKQILNPRIALTIARAKINGLKLSKDLVRKTSHALHKNTLLCVMSVFMLLLPKQVYLFLRNIIRTIK